MTERVVVGMVKQGQSQKGTTRGLHLLERPGLRPGSSLWWHFGAEGARMQRMQRSLPQREHDAL